MSKTLVGWIGLSLLCALPARGLERVSLPAGDAAPWASASSVTVAYYNFRTGWLWVDAVYPGDQFGVVVESPHPGAVLVACDLFQEYVHINDTGYGHLATVAVHAVDSQDCPTGAPLASVPWTDTEDSPRGWVTYGFGIPVPDRFALTVTMHEWADPKEGAVLLWDHPGAGPTGLRPAGSATRRRASRTPSCSLRRGCRCARERRSSTCKEPSVRGNSCGKLVSRARSGWSPRHGHG